jgi:hypothetical protein
VEENADVAAETHYWHTYWVRSAPSLPYVPNCWCCRYQPRTGCYTLLARCRAVPMLDGRRHAGVNLLVSPCLSWTAALAHDARQRSVILLPPRRRAAAPRPGPTADMVLGALVCHH